MGWSRAIRRIFFCGSGAEAPEGDEPVYQNLESQRQAHDAADTLRRLMEVVGEVRELLVPIADVPDRMRQLELNLHPLLVYRPEDGEYMDMRNGSRPAPAAPPPTPPPPRSVWLMWLLERIDYGEPW